MTLESELDTQSVFFSLKEKKGVCLAVYLKNIHSVAQKKPQTFNEVFHIVRYDLMKTSKWKANNEWKKINNEWQNDERKEEKKKLHS